MRLPRGFYERDTAEVARDLLGKFLCHSTCDGLVSGKVVESEAYYGVDDPASRASSKKTKINEKMWERGGLALIYMVHGNWLFNVTTEREGTPGAVLIRALEPVDGLSIMKSLRKKEELSELTSGPGKLTQALDISKDLHGVDLTISDRLYISGSGEVGDPKIESSHRIGVTEDLQRELRFYIGKSECVSR